MANAAGSPVVGLTGGIASGKSTATQCFADLGWEIIDTDVIARGLTTPGSAALDAIRATFGDQVFNEAGLDRTRLREIVFDDPARRRSLEAILHPRIRAEARRQLDAVAAPALLVIPLLAENLAAWRPLIDEIVVVDCEPVMQIARLRARDALSPERIQSILDAQSPRAARLAIADHVFLNTGSRDALCAAVRAYSSARLRASPPP